MRFVPFGRWAAAALSSAALAFAGPALAQAGGPGFSFTAPQGSISLRGGFAAASAGGDVLGFATDNLTLGRGDFGGAMLSADIGVVLPGRDARLELVFGSALEISKAESEFRDWVDDADQPITQTTTFRRVPVTAGLKAYLTPRGRSVGHFAWVPARVAPYVGAGGGGIWYRFRQDGEFVDFETLAIAGRRYESSGWAPAAYAGAGVDLSLGTFVGLTADARYRYARVSPGGDFADFDRIDLSGVSTTLGFNFRF